MNNALIRCALEVNWRHLALGHEVFEAEGATFVRNRDLPGIYDGNFVAGVTASTADEIGRLLERAGCEYTHAARLTFRVDPFTPPEFEARLVLEGYVRNEAILLILDGSIGRAPVQCDIRQVDDEAAWNAFAILKHLDWREHTTSYQGDPADGQIAQAFAHCSRLKCPPAHYVLAYADDQPVGYCCAWEGLRAVGQVEDLFVHPAIVVAA